MRRLSLLAIILWMLLVMNEENREDIYVCVYVCVCVCVCIIMMLSMVPERIEKILNLVNQNHIHILHH